jgi:YgiT-type zinc finger domain-containing protein
MAKTRTKARSCPKCGGTDLKRRSKTYPLLLHGRQINVGRVSVLECAACGHLTPTEEGKAKLQRFLQVAGGVLGKP